MDKKVNVFWDRMADRKRVTIEALKSGKCPKIIRYAMHLTSRCNLRCSYCREDKFGPIIPREFFSGVCHEAGKDGIIHITGGEPMVVPWLEGELSNLQGVTRFALNTNLVKMPQQKTLDVIFRLKTSLDDYEGDRWNKLVGGNVFTRVVEHIKQASEAIGYTSICYTATHYNAHRLRRFIEFCQAKFPKLYAISVSFVKGKSEMALKQEDIEELFSASELLDPISKTIFLETHAREGNYFPENIEVPCYLSMTERLYDCLGREFYCSHMFRDKVIPPGNPGKDPVCVTGCNARFVKFNLEVHKQMVSYDRRDRLLKV